jgi:hypothetical protein
MIPGQTAVGDHHQSADLFVGHQFDGVIDERVGGYGPDAPAFGLQDGADSVGEVHRDR